ncbi:putative LRR receptor-like serine/threonine-protein kinase At4g29180 isoform X4 [Tasmannia lanceolata]|uniref:putative LRR receptor-like serine/threonine-protein kinase At4g29180 isoform X4 n=1 Tax=Tasmannia lanceolata TaxID=3420 RepID=UPI004063383B
MVMGGIFLLLAFLVSAAVFVHGQPGFISIDCGIAEGVNYTDLETYIDYTSDAGFIDTGKNHNISSTCHLKSSQRVFQNLRSFPEGNRSCYTLKPVVKGNKYLIRASFMYGNYDGRNNTPVFDLYFGANLRHPMDFQDANKRKNIEIMTMASMDFFSVCLANTGSGTPFISALELRPLKNGLYRDVNEFQSLLLHHRFNPGASTNRDVRYPDDPYDRVWTHCDDGSWTLLSNSTIVKNKQDLGFEPPTMVMSTAVRPLGVNDNLKFSFPLNFSNSGLQFYVYMHFTELQLLEGNQLREFTVSLNGAFLLGPFSPKNQITSTLSTPSPLTGNENYTIALDKTRNSTLPPILNAYEIHYVKQHLESPTNEQDGLCTSYPCRKKHRKFIIPVIVGVLVVAVMVGFTILIVCHKFRGRRQGEPAVKASEEESLVFSRNRRFTYTEIMHMTKNFQRIIGRGGYGTVYHGHMKDGNQVAIKLFSQIHHGTNEFQTEAQLLMRFHHKNLVRFFGYCAEGNNRALILEYMVRGNLAKVLSAKGDDSVVLNWGQRLRIGMDVAQGLEYLHTGCKPPIIHRDVKAANILINERLEAKIADFGMSKALHDEDLTHISTDVKGTQGYLDPEYFISNNLNEKSDVYSFGVVLLELITGKTAITRHANLETVTLVQWVTDMIGRGDIRSIVDPRLQGHYDVNSAWKAIEIAIACTPPIAIQRPSMSDVVMELKEFSQVDIAPEESRMSMMIEQPEILPYDSMSYPSAR